MAKTFLIVWAITCAQDCVATVEQVSTPRLCHDLGRRLVAQPQFSNRVFVCVTFNAQAEQF